MALNRNFNQKARLVSEIQKLTIKVAICRVWLASASSHSESLRGEINSFCPPREVQIVYQAIFFRSADLLTDGPSLLPVLYSPPLMALNVFPAAAGWLSVFPFSDENS